MGKWVKFGGGADGGRQSGQAVLAGAFAVMLLSISMVAGVRYFGPKLSLGNQQATGKQMSDVVQKALWAYVSRNYRLPCPADGTVAYGSANDGVEQPLGGSAACTITSGGAPYAGVVPWKTLGIQPTDAVDGWGDRLGYAVGAASTLTTGTPFKTQIPVAANNKVQVSVNGATASAYAYALISFGPDRGGGYAIAGSRTATSKSTSTELPNTLASAFTGTTAFSMRGR